MTLLAQNTYGKARVRLVKVMRGPSGHDLKEWNVKVLFEGDYESCFVSGDNSRILPTDTMKNTVYSLARDSSANCIEDFAKELAAYFLENNAAASSVSVEITEKKWQHVTVDGAAHPTTFQQTANDLNTTQATVGRGADSTVGEVAVTSGLKGLILLKTANSAFEGYIQDRLTTLKESSDRLFGTEVTASWTYTQPELDYPALRKQITETLLAAFAAHVSLSVQHTLYAMGEAVLADVGAVGEIRLTMPNRHCLLVNLEPFGQDNPNEIFVPIDEPHGYIEATLRR